MTVDGSRPETQGRRGVGAEPLFERVVCVVDGSPEAAEAARQVDVLMPRGRVLELVTIVGEAELGGGWGDGYTLSSGAWRERLDPALGALSAGRPAEVRPIYRSGPEDAALVDELSARDATLVALPVPHPHHALPPFLDYLLHGSLAAKLVHDGPCSVLIARSDHGLPRRFRILAVADDGSPAAARAVEVAAALASRVGLDITVHHGEGADLELLADTRADLALLGSRGLHGLRALRDAGERVAEASAASVLVVRGL